MSTHSAPDSHIVSRLPTSSPIQPENACEKLFQALDRARFDQVRRAVAANSDCLRSTNTPSLTAFTTNPNTLLNPIDYALHNCDLWIALQDHWRRTGGGPDLNNLPGELTFRSRLQATPAILSFLISHPDAPPLSYNTLHYALSCDLFDVVRLILKKRPELACLPDNRGKSPVHTAVSLASRTAPSRITSYIHLLASYGANVCAKDIQRRTPLHDLVDTLRPTTTMNGLSHRGRHSRTLTECAPIISALLLHGADLYVQDHHHRTPLSAAFSSRGEYMIFAECSHAIRTFICSSPSATTLRLIQPAPSISGIWGILPEEVIMKIFSNLSPKDVATGIGATCKGLRRVAVHPDTWLHMEKARCIQHVRMIAHSESIHPNSMVGIAASL